jgi:hypothetical protein
VKWLIASYDPEFDLKRNVIQIAVHQGCLNFGNSLVNLLLLARL